MRLKVVSYLISSSNHNRSTKVLAGRGLFLISFHHQTTTIGHFLTASIELFLISFHHQTTTGFVGWAKGLPLFLISFHHQTTTMTSEGINSDRCFLSHFIIKPQRSLAAGQTYIVVSYLISSSNHNGGGVGLTRWGVVSYLISSSNHNLCLLHVSHMVVVSYLISSSNHNKNALGFPRLPVVSYLISSSNHNLYDVFYLILEQ